MKKRSVNIAGHQTSVSMEEEFWDVLKQISEKEGRSVREIIKDIDDTNPDNLSSAIRVYILKQILSSLESKG